MNHKPQITEQNLPHIRWDIIRTLRVGGHLGATERMIKDVLIAGYIEVSDHFIRDQITYLEKRKLIDVSRSEIEPWRLTLTRHGYDIADYQVDCEPGIHRPPHWNKP